MFRKWIKIAILVELCFLLLAGSMAVYSLSDSICLPQERVLESQKGDTLQHDIFPSQPCIAGYQDGCSLEMTSENVSDKKEKKEYIKWVEFEVPCEALGKAYEWDLKLHEQAVRGSWIELLAYLAVKYGGDYKKYREKDLNEIAEGLLSGEYTMDELTKDKKYYAYYLEAYTAVLGGMVGEYEIEVMPEGGTEKVWEKKYGLKAFSPIAKGYAYNDYDDFGTSRSYGYSRPHLGHDMMGLVGTPIIAVESGYVEAIGWNRYGGWRLGIRSFDKKRYYYYAHMRQNFPYHKSLKEGSVVQAGDVIGYMGHTGYSTKENVNNIKETHLHWGLQLIFDESQKEGNNEIWVNCYELSKFLSRNRSETWKEQKTKEYYRVYEIKDPSAAGKESSPAEMGRKQSGV